MDAKENECAGCQRNYNRDGEIIKQHIIVGRPISGTALNGEEYLLDSANNLIVFDSIQDAKDYLLANGILAEELENFNYREDKTQYEN